MAQLRDLNVIIIKRPKFIKYIYSFIQSNKIWFHIHKIIKRRAHKVHLYVSGTNPKWDLFPNLTFDLTWTNKNKVKKNHKKMDKFCWQYFFFLSTTSKKYCLNFFPLAFSHIIIIFRKKMGEQLCTCLLIIFFIQIVGSLTGAMPSKHSGTK